VEVPLRDVGIPVGFHPHGTRAEILAALGLTAQDVARDVTEWVSELEFRAGEPQAAR
jgi:1-deoxy-D-xylulose-5-phosphate synthase